MNFLSWYLSVGAPSVLALVGNFVLFIEHYFSILELSRTLFAPWKKLLPEGGKGGSIGLLLDRLSFGLISRSIGALVRLGTIVMGLIFLVVVGALAGLSAVIVLAIPLPLIPYYFSYVGARMTYTRGKNLQEMVERVTKSNFFEFFCRRSLVERGKLAEALAAGAEAEKAAVYKEASDYANAQGHNYVTHVAMLRALLRNSKGVLDVLRGREIKLKDIDRICDWYHQLAEEEIRNEFWSRQYLLSIHPIGRDWSSGFTNMVDEFCEDLSQVDLRWFPFVGRDELIGQITKQLERSSEQNVLLYGPPGSGRHSLIRGLAKKIQWHELDGFNHKRVMVFRSEKFLAESHERDAAEKLFSILSEAEAAGNVILVLDNFDQMLRGKAGEHSVEGVLEEKLSRGKLQVIALASQDAFEGKLKQEAGVMKLFAPIEMNPMRADDVWPVVFDQIEVMESKRGVAFSYAAVREVIEASDKYERAMPFPEKAIDLIDEVVSFAESRRADLISKSDVDQVMSLKTKVPIGKMQENERAVLLKVEEELKKQIVEQEQAISKIGKALRRARTGVQTGQKPIGTFLFLGPTGVGKTETAKVLSQSYFKTREFTRFDMAEFQSSEGVERLIGSVRGGDPGLLAKKIGERPYGVLLLDEFEKAPREVHNLFLSVLDEGSFSAANGTRVYCNNLMVIATSNAGSEQMREYLNSGGGVNGMEGVMTEYLLKNNLFAPELLNRFDAVVFYRPLSEMGLKRVTEMILERLAERMRQDKDVEVEFSDGLIDKILSEGYDANFGARSIQRYVNDTVADEVAKKLLENPEIKQVRV